MNTLTHSLAATVLLDLVVILTLARAVGALLRRIGQPAVVGEILAGIALGPSLLGRIPVGDATLASLMFPANAVQQLSGLANLGLVIFMLIVGLELNLRPARADGRRAVVISLASVLLPLVLGAFVGAQLYAAGAGGGSRIAFTLFLGVAMSITAFPVLARILVDRQLHRTPLGVLVIACAGVDDVLAWSLLAVATAVKSGGTGSEAVRVLLHLGLFCLVLMFVARPALKRLAGWHGRVGHLTPTMLIVVLVGLVSSAAATEYIGVHFVFGAFFFGATLQRHLSAAFIRELLDRMEQFTVLALLPIFFVVTGLSVDLSSLELSHLGVFGAILLVACVGKFVGAAGAARLMRVPARQSLAIGILMNTRGLTELVVVKVGYEAGIISRGLFTILVVMAVVTTIMTKPLLGRVYPDKLIARDVADAESLALAPDCFSCLILTDDPTRAADYAGLARDLAPTDRPTEIVLSWSAPPLGLGSGTKPSHELGVVTSGLEEANALAAEISNGSVNCSVIFQCTDQPQLDLERQIESLQPDCLITDAGFRHSDAVVSRLPSTGRLLLVDADAPMTTKSAVTVALSGGADAVATLRIGLSLAASRRVPLRILDSPVRRPWARAARLAERLTRAGVATRPIASAMEESNLVVAERASRPTFQKYPRITVYGARPEGANELGQLISALPEPDSSTSSPRRSRS